MTDNPYAAPEANVDVPPQGGGEHRISDPRAVSAGRGWQWIAGGFRYFAASPLPWILAMLAWFGILFVTSWLPLINFLITAITPVMIGGFMIGCDAEDRGEHFTVGHAFAGFQQPASKPLFVAGGLYLLGSMLLGAIAGVMLVLFAGTGALAMLAGGASGGESIALGGESFALGGMAIAVLATLALSVPLLMAFYFAPPLIALGKLRAVDAIKLSFVACLRNMLPFLVFGIIVVVFGILAMIPLLMGFLVLFPVMIAAGYTAYRDIFIHQEDVLLGPGQQPANMQPDAPQEDYT